MAPRLRLLPVAGCLLSLVVLLGSTITSSGAAASHSHPRRCFPHGAQTIALNRHVRVYSIPEYVEGAHLASSGTYACLLRRGTTLTLAPPRSGKRPRRGHELVHITFADAIVAFVDFQFYIDHGCEAIQVVDMARRRMVLSVPNVACRGKVPFGQAVTDLVVDEHGSVAWIAQTWRRLRGGPITSVSFEVHSATTSGSTTLLDSGAGIAPGSLRLAPGGEVSWLDAGRVLYASLP